MKEENVRLLTKILGLKRHIVGIRFLPYRQEFEESSAEVVKPARSFCSMVHKASQGYILKASSDCFSCPGGAQALGIQEEPEYVKSGRLYQHCGLYVDYTTAKKINDRMLRIEHKMYGVEIAPLELMEKVDIVIILGSAKQAMRLMQGYAYEHGPADNLATIGNQAMCSDLVSKPFNNNDINISLMCVGARASAHCDDGEVGVGMPIHLFDSVVNGVLQTLNLTETNQAKKEILERLDTPDELGFPIVMNFSYGNNSQAYRRYCAKMQSEE